MGIRVEKATEMGFCFGVRRALDLVAKALEQGPLESLGALVHNAHIIEELTRSGVAIVKEVDEVGGRRVVISTHGVGPEVMSRMKQRRLVVIDATCPFVRKAQETAMRLAGEGYWTVVYGDARHPEVAGVLGWAEGRGIATLDVEEAVGFARQHSPLGVLSQTTQSPEHFEWFVAEVAKALGDSQPRPRSFTTICPPTRRRHDAALELASKVDLMLVIGGHNSANTRRLVEVCASSGVVTHHVEGASEIDPGWIADHSCIGITAGASTPDQVIDEAIHKLEEIARERQREET